MISRYYASVLPLTIGNREHHNLNHICNGLRKTTNGQHRGSIMEKTRIEGIKLSDELFQVNFRNNSDSKKTLSQLCQILASNQINMPFLSSTCLGDRTQMSCCVAAEDKARVRNLIDSELVLREHVKFISSVGLLSLFPHKFSLKILGNYR